MAKVKITRANQGLLDNKPWPAVDSEVEVRDSLADALVRFNLAERLDGEKPAEADAETADNRETRAEKPAEDKPAEAPKKRGPGRPRKTDK